MGEAEKKSKKSVSLVSVIFSFSGKRAATYF